MFKIRKAQMEAFELEAERLLPQRILRMLQGAYPEECAEMGQEGVLELIRAAIERAAVHGMAAPGDAAVFAGLAFVYGPGFEEERWAAGVLRDERLQGKSYRAGLLLEAAGWHDRMAERRTRRAMRRGAS